MLLVACTQDVPSSVEHEGGSINKKDEPSPSLTRISEEVPGANCPEGGSKLEEGFDDNFNGMLDPGEVLRTEYACNGLITLITTERFSSHASCEGSGMLVRSGVDDDGDGVLASGEVDEETALCDGSGGGSCGPDNTIDGNMRLESSLDVNQISDCETITGDLVVAYDVASLELARLRTVGGRLELLDEVGDFLVPALETVGGALVVNRDRSRVHLPALTSAGDVTMPWASLLDAPELTTMTGSLETDDWSTVLLPELTTLGANLSPGRGTLVRAPKLEAIPGNLLARTSSRLELPSASTVGGNFTIQGEVAVTMPGLLSVDGTLSLGASQVVFSNLGQAADIEVIHNSSATASLSAPNLSSATALVLVPGPGGANVSLPGLTTLGRLHLERTVATLELPQLTQVGTLELLPEGHTLTAVPATITQVTQALTIDMAEAFQFGRLELSTLAQVGGAVTISEADATAVAFPLLTSVGGVFSLAGRGTRLQTLELPLLQSAGGLSVSNNSALSSFDLSTLDTVTGDVSFTGNTSLSECDIADLETELVLGTLGGSFTNEGNLADVCEELAEPCPGDREVDVRDIVLIRNCSEIGGSLTVNGGDPNDDVTLPLLRRIGGNFDINGAVGALDAPLLREIGQYFRISGSLGTSSTLPALEDIGSAFTSSDSGTLSLPVLAQIDFAFGGDLVVGPGFMLTAESLTQVTGPVRVNDGGALVAPALQSAGGSLRVLAGARAEVDALASVGHDILVEDDATLLASALLQAPRNLNIGVNSVAHLTSVQSVGGDLDIGFGATTTFTSLTSVTGAIDVFQTSVRFPALTDAGSFFLRGTDASTSPVTLEVGSAAFNDRLHFRGNVDCLLPQATFVEELYIEFGKLRLSAPNLDRVTTFFYEADTPSTGYFHLPALRELGSLTVVGASHNLRTALTALETVTGGVSLRWSGSTPGEAWRNALYMPELISVGGTFSMWRTMVRHIELPKLANVGSINFRVIELLRTLSMPSLTNVGSVTVSGNSRLEPCEVAALDARLDAVGHTGQRDFTNNASGTCTTPCVVNGNYTINNGSDAAAIADCDEVTGDLTFASGISGASLPQLERVGGSLTMPETPMQEPLPRLSTVGVDLDISTTGGVFSLPQLVDVGGDLSLAGDTAITAPSLSSVRGNLVAGGRLSSNSLNWVGDSLTVSVDGVLVAPGLGAVASSVTIRDHADAVLSGLVSVGTDLQLDRGATLVAGVLGEVPGRVGMSTSAQLDAALLRSVGGDFIMAGEVQVDTPSLATVGGVLEVGASHVSLPALTQVSNEGIRISHFSSAPASLTLATIRTLPRVQLRARGTFSAPEATQAGNLEMLSSNVTAELPKLVQAGNLECRDRDAVTLNLGALTQLESIFVSGCGSNLAGQLSTLSSVSDRFVFSENTALVADESFALDLSSLTTIGGLWSVSENARLNGLQAGALTTVGARVTIRDNPQLPECEVAALIQALIDAGNNVPFTNEGNAPCP